MNTFFAVIFSLLNATVAPDSSVVHLDNMQVFNSNFDAYLSLMASGDKGDPLTCILSTSDPKDWVKAKNYIDQKLLVQTSSQPGYQAYRLTARGVKAFKVKK